MSDNKAPAYPQPSKFISEEKIDLHGYVSALHKHDPHDLEGIIKSSHEAEQLLAKKNFQEFFSESGQDFYRGIKDSTAKATGHLKGSGQAIELDHYKTRIHESQDNIDAFLRSFIHEGKEYLGKLGHQDFSELDVGSMDSETLEQTALEVARDKSRYHGRVNLGGQRVTLAQLLQNTVLNKTDANKDTTFGEVYQTLSSYITKATENLPSGVSESVLDVAGAKQMSKSYSQRVAGNKQVAGALGLPLKDSLSDTDFASKLGVNDMRQIYSLSQRDLEEEIDTSRGPAALLDTSKLYKDAA